MVARIAELLSSGARVMAIAADAGRRAALAEAGRGDGAAARRRATVCVALPADELLRPLARRGGAGSLLTDWATLAGLPDGGAAASSTWSWSIRRRCPISTRLALAGLGAGYLHEAGAPARELAELCWGAEWDLRGPLAEIYRALAPRELGGEELGAALRGPGRFGRSPEAAARCVRVLVRSASRAEAPERGRPLDGGRILGADRTGAIRRLARLLGRPTRRA